MILDVGPLLRTVRRQPGIWTLMVLEIAAAVTTIGSLLISGSWYGQSGALPSGLDESNLILISTYTPSSAAAPAIAEQEIVNQERGDRRLVLGIPGVVAATRVTSSIVEDRWSYPSLFAAPDRQSDAVGWATYADDQLAPALALRFLAGGVPAREGAGADAAANFADAERPVGAVLTRCLAERLFGGAATAVGGRLSSATGGDVPVTGVVEDVIMRMPLVPFYRCTAFLFGGAPRDHQARLIVRVQPGRRVAVLAALTAAFMRSDAGESVRRWVEIVPFDSQASNHHRIGHGLVLMLGMFGAMVALVALLGALAATSFLVAQRTRQIGIRRALGATKADIVAYFVLESALAAAMGSVIGVASTVGLFMLMRRVFHQIHFRPALVALALGVLWLGSILATLLPALRAARVPPSVAGRSL